MLVARTDLATALVTGPDRTSWLNALLTCDVTRLTPGSAIAGLALNKKGRVLSEVFTLATPERLLLAIDAAAAPALIEHFDQHLVMEDAELTKAEPSLSWFIAYGSSAAAASEGESASLTHFGEPARLFALPAGAVPQGEPVTSLQDFDAARVQLGLMRYGVEFSESTYPEEASLDEHAINFNKGCYLGQEIVVKMRSRGHPARKVVRLRGHALSVGAPVLTASGETTGSILSVSGDRCLAFASVRFPDSQPGANLRVEDREVESLPARGAI